jgi:hypothetical protein
MQATTPAFGPIEKGDSLTFDYRFADLTGQLGAILGAADKLEVLISTDCGATFRQVAVINSSNHTVSAQMKKFSVHLDSFTNQYIRIRFLASWGQGDYYIDLDNIQVLRCPPSLGLSIVVAGAGTSGKTATVLSQSLSGPYSYTWNTGGTTPSIPLLSNGTFTVTVTDRNGCQDIASTLVTSTREQLVLEKLSLAPNPTSGSSQLTILFPEATPATIQVISLYGQVLQEARFNRSAQINMDIHLNTQPDGLYFIRILANGKSRTEKLTLIKP